MKPSEIIQNMRKQAAALVEMANALESEMSLKEGSVTLTPEAIKSVIKIKGMRPQHLAAHFNVPVAAITQVVRSENSGLKLNQRGWVKEVRVA